MPWSNQNGGGSGGPWGQRGGSNENNNNNGPWGGGPKGNGGDGPPDFEKYLQQGRNFFKDMFPGSNGFGAGSFFMILLGGLILWLATGFYTIRPNEIGIELLFGKYIGKSTIGEGLRYNWPAPLGGKIKLDVTKQETMRIGFVGTAERRTPVFDEALMLTGDDNLIFINFTVIWNIKPEQAEKYIFNFKNPQKTLKAVAESTMREYIGQGKIMDLITSGRSEVEPIIRQNMQKTLDQYEAGIRVASVQLTDAQAPEEVRQAFFDVQAASQKASRYIEEAGKERNKLMPKAYADAARLIANAEAYKRTRVESARGQANRFLSVLAEYKKNPSIIKDRMYIESIEKVLTGSSKTIVNTTSSTIINTGGSSPVIPFPVQNNTTNMKEVEVTP